nr:copia protein [Tanacetum cinerariifolium]
MNLIEAAKTMLADSFLPTIFWAEAVNIACQVLNRSSYSTHVKSSRDKIRKNEKPVNPVEQIFQKELKKLKRQEKEANYAARKEATHETQDVNTNNTNLLNTVSTPVSAVGPSRALNDDEPSYPNDPLMPHLEDIYASPSARIFTNLSYDNEGVVTDFNNLETTVNVSSTPTTGIHTVYPKTQILRYPLSAVQTRSKVYKNSEAHALKAIGTKWVYRNKKDERGVVVRNKAILVAQGHREEEGIDYDEVFAPVVRIEAIRIFLAFASYMGFIVYQMDVKSAFLYSTINEKVYVTQPLGFVDPKLPNKVKQKEDGIFISQDKYVAEILKKFDFLSVKTASTPIEAQKPLVKDEEDADIDVYLYRYAFIASPTIRTSCIKQFWSTAKVKTVNDEVKVQALIDGKKCLSAKTTYWNEFSNTMASTIICLATNQKIVRNTILPPNK